MADEHTADSPPGGHSRTPGEGSEPTADVDRPASPWEPARPDAPSAWAPTPPAEPAPPPVAPPADPVEESAPAAPPPSGPPPPAWQVGSPGPTAWGDPAVAVPAPPRPAGSNRPVLLAAVTGAVVGALVAGLLLGVVKDDEPSNRGQPLTFSENTSKIPRTGDIQEILAKVQPAVVSIRTRTLSLGDFLRPVPGEGAGTGFVIAPDGVIVTNNHVVAGAQSIEVVFADDRKMPARVLGRDPSSDLAVLKVDGADLAVAALGDSDALRVGDDVIAIGNALGLQGGLTVTRGIVSADDRTITAEDGTRLEHVIQTDTAINPGNSGGPLVNAAGEVVGINTAVAGGAENIGFAIAINAAKPIIEQLRQGGTRSRPFLGVRMFTVTPSVAEELGLQTDSGALVADVTAGSAAEVAGLRTGDVITSIGGKDVEAAEDVTAAVNERKPGDEMKVRFRRGQEEREVTVKLGERPVDAG